MLRKYPRSLYHSYKEYERLQQLHPTTYRPPTNSNHPTMNSKTTPFPIMNWCQPIWTTGKVAGFSNYTVCRHGNVVNDEKKTVLKGTIDKTGGYRYYHIKNDEGVKKRMLGHRLVALALIPNPEQKEMVDHIDRNKLNNHISNLRWATNSENQINTCMRPRKIKGDGYRHIRERTMNGKQYYELKIQRKGKYILYERFEKDECTIEQVVQFRNEFYKTHDITIEDE